MRPVWQLRLRWRLRLPLRPRWHLLPLPLLLLPPDDVAAATTDAMLPLLLYCCCCAAELLQLYENSINFHQIIEINFQLQLGGGACNLYANLIKKTLRGCFSFSSSSSGSSSGFSSSKTLPSLPLWRSPK